MAERRGRGFASMDPEAQRAIASMGGRAAHESGHAHEWNSEEAARAGHRGGLAAHRRDKPGTPADAAPVASATHSSRRRAGKRTHVDVHGQPSQRRGRQPREHESGDQRTPNPDRDPEQNSASQAGDNQGCPSS
jgi:general stress protein YciG